MDLTLAKSLYRWAKNKDENIAKLESWLETALLEVVAGKGSQVVATSANGVSISFGSAGLTNQAWFNTLTLALQYIEQGAPTSKIQGVIR